MGHESTLSSIYSFAFGIWFGGSFSDGDLVGLDALNFLTRTCGYLVSNAKRARDVWVIVYSTQGYPQDWWISHETW